jgi:glycosyltransferase involved in cell wall biosynthesis
MTGEEMEQGLQSIGRPLVSIILPVYNAWSVNPDYLIEALESIYRQTYKSFELIIVDDGSTDDSVRLCRNFMADHPDLDVRYYYKDNGGQSSARNFGAEMSQGDYLCFMDQDDLGYENMLEVRISYFDPETDLLYTDADIIDAGGSITLQGIHRNHGHGSPHPKSSLDDILFKDIVVMTGLMMIKKETFFRVKGFDKHLTGYEDDDLFLRIFGIGKIKYIPVSTLQWRVYDKSCSRSDRMILSRSYYYHKLISGYTDNGKDMMRVKNISWRFFRLFLVQAISYQRKNDEMFVSNMAGVRETLSFLQWSKKLFFGLPLLLGEKTGVKLIRWIYLKRSQKTEGTRGHGR